MTALYLAGPMRGIPRHNWPAFDETTALLRAAGFEVFNPAEHARASGFDSTRLPVQEIDRLANLRIKEYLLADLTWILTKADGIALLSNWQHSSGALAEVATAKAVGIPVALAPLWITRKYRTEGGNGMSVPLRPPGTNGPDDRGDPAYWMLERGRVDPSWRSTPRVYEAGCYICDDPEFALMGLPLCRPCPACSSVAGRDAGHVPADDVICTVCGLDELEEHERRHPPVQNVVKDL